MASILSLPLLSWMIGQVFEKMSFLLPVNRVRENDRWLAFHHPRPSHAFHILIVPKKAVHSLADLDLADTDLLRELYAMVRDLVAEFKLSAYRLIVNGGDYQDFPQLHFHLISDAQAVPSAASPD